MREKKKKNGRILFPIHAETETDFSFLHMKCKHVSSQACAPLLLHNAPLLLHKYRKKKLLYFMVNTKL